jgi:hypothetical protein
MMTERFRTLVLAAGVMTLLTVFPAGISGAATVAGVSVPDQVTLEESGEKLVLNGAGVRKKFIIKVYVGALYLPAKETTVEGIVNGPGSRRVTMHFLYKEVEAKKLVAAWNDGFAGNLTGAEQKALAERLAAFNSLFVTVKSGDAYALDMVAGKGTTVRLNGAEVGRIAGDDFSRALLKVWLGDKPADKGLKKAWLGK